MTHNNRQRRSTHGVRIEATVALTQGGVVVLGVVVVAVVVRGRGQIGTVLQYDTAAEKEIP